MAQIMHKGKTYNMSMKDFYVIKRAEEIFEELISKPEVHDKLNELLRKHKLNKIKNEIENR